MPAIGAIPAWAVNRLGQALASTAIIASADIALNELIPRYGKPVFPVRAPCISIPIACLSCIGYQA